MRFRTALIWNVVSQFGQSGIQFLATIILARLLTPDDFGIIGIVTIFIAFSQMVVDSEMGGALLRKKECTQVDYSTLFYYNLGVSLLLYIILFFGADLIASFYSKPALVEIIRILSLTVIIHAFRVVQKIMIFRALQFHIMAIINIVSGVVSLLSAIYIAYLGYGYWALVWQQIIMASLNVVLMGWHNRFMPSLVFSKESFKYQFGFGISLLGSDTIKTIANNISTNIIAKISSLDFTGFYTQSSRITAFCQSTLGSLMDQSIFPMMARMENVADISRMYHRIFYLVCFALTVLSCLLIAFSSFIIHLILGDKWMEAEWIFQILCLAILPTSLQVLGRNLLKVVAKTKKVFYLEIVKSIIVLGCLLGGVFGGSIMVVWGVVISQMISCLLWIVYVEKEFDDSVFKPILSFSISTVISCLFYYISI